MGRTPSHVKKRRLTEQARRYTQPFSQEACTDINLPVRIAYESLRTGQGHEADFHTLAAAINVALVRGDAVPECVRVCQEAQAALMRMMERHHRLGVWGMDGMALQEIPPAIDLYEQIVETSTPQQLMEAMRETVRRMRRGDVYEGATV